ncbi:MAG: ABC transporter permease [Gammaproteobacteria bacterium]|nr:ABC transporter permease [Gammaproteobacteria bacterium]
MRSLPLITSLAWRNLWRNKRRTMVILFAMVLGVWAMIVTAAFMRGMAIQMLDDTVNNLTGHIQIHHKNYLDDPVIENSFFGNDTALLNTLKLPDIIHWSSRIRVPAVISSERETRGVVLLAIEPEAEANISFLKNAITEGQYFSSNDENGIIIGKKLAQNLETRLGKRVVVMSQNTKNEIADSGYRISGIYDTSGEGMETDFIFITKRAAEQLLDSTGLSSEIAVITRSLDTVLSVQKNLAAKNPELDIQDWSSLQPYTKLVVEMYSDFQYVWHLIVFLAMSFGIINTLLMTIYERTREFGLFQALGLKPGFILVQVWTEALFMLTIALFIGNFVSWLTVMTTGDGIDVSAFSQGMELAQMSNIIPFVILFEDLLLANIIVIALGLLTSLYPAWKASQLVPADAITRI